jgi:hypothetical protein
MVTVFYFDTGLTIIADKKKDEVFFEYPMVFQNQVDPNGRIQVMFNPMFMFTKKTKFIPISLNGLLFAEEADDKMKEKYNGIVTQARSATSGIIIPGGSAIDIKPNIRKPSIN